MRALLPSQTTCRLHGATATRRIEAAAASTLPFNTLMQRAGTAVAHLALAVAPHARQVWVVAGPGNNGGDGFEAACHLHAAGLAVRVAFGGDRARLPTDAAAAFARAHAAGVLVEDARPALGPLDIAIDALFGLGASRVPEGSAATRIDQLNALPCAVLAVDVPSGLDADTGQPLGDRCVRATHTLSLLTAKPGLFTAAGRDHAGRVWLDHLGVDLGDEPADAWLLGPEANPAPQRPHASHKGSFGDVAVVGGASGMAGAALLAARAAHAAGAGRVYLELLDAAHGTAPELSRPELMARPGWSLDSDARTLSQTTTVCGCGAGDLARRVLPRLLSLVPRLVLDADALNAIAADEALASMLTRRARRGHATVLTPHPLEAARLLGSDTATVQRDRLRAAKELAERFCSVVVLKGSGSVIARPGLPPDINPTGNASLASAGTGDVLAGWIAGGWAAAGGATADDAAHRAARAAVWLHGAAADAERMLPMRAADLIEAMHRASNGR